MGVFILAILTKKTHALGANVGIVAGVALNICLWLYVPEIFWFWWNAIGCFVTIGMGMLTSSLVKRKINEGISIGYYAGKKEMGLLALYLVFIVIFSYIIPTLF